MSDKVGKINCPACGKQMVEIFMPEQGINLDVCLNGCGGIYFDNREFQHFDTPNQNINELTSAMKDKTFNKVDETVTRICPVCKAKMVKNFTSGTQNVQIDECYSCGGKFLDYGELLKIRNEEQYSDAMQKVCTMVGAKLTKDSAVKKLFDSLIN